MHSRLRCNCREALAHRLILKGESLHKRQITVPQRNGQYTFLTLNECGLRKFAKCKALLRKEKFRGHFVCWRFAAPDPSNPYNIIVRGREKRRPDEVTQTSVVLFAGQGWVYTVTGHLYAIPVTNCTDSTVCIPQLD